MSENIGRRGLGLRYLGLRDGKKWWRARLFWVDKRTGKEHEKQATFQADSKPLALAERARRVEAERDGVGTAKTRKRFAEVADESAATIKRHGTRVTAESINRRLNEKFGTWWLDEVKPRYIVDYLDSLEIKSVSNVRAALSRVFRHAKRKHYIAANPMAEVELKRREVTIADVQPQAPRALTPEQVDLYFADLEKHEPDLYPMVHVQFMLGCRFSEVSALRLSDVDLESGLVLIACAQYQGKEGPPKGNESREFALPLESRAVLRAHLDRMAVERWPGWERLVFPRPQWPQARRVASVYWSSSTIDSKIRDSFKRLGFAVRGTTHAARHTLITVADGLSASESLLREVVGHRDRRVHEGYKGRRTARVISLADAVGGALLRGRTGTKTGTPGADSGEDR